MKKRISLIILFLFFCIEAFSKAYFPQKTDKDLEVYSFDVPIYYDFQVRKWMDFFKKDHRKRFRIWMERSYKYLPIMRNIFKEHNLPEDLIYLSLIESGFYSHAKSSSKAVGYWQFLKKTGRQYGLKINWWIDERRDLIKSTKAAARYLKYLYKRFNNWHLALAAYNMGENRLARLMRKYKSLKRFQDLSLVPEFPKETKNYVPQFIASLILNKSRKLHGFQIKNPHVRHRFSWLSVPGGTDLIELSKKVPINYRKIKKLNPELNYGFIPKGVKKYHLKIPRTRYSVAIKHLRQDTY